MPECIPIPFNVCISFGSNSSHVQESMFASRLDSTAYMYEKTTSDQKFMGRELSDASLWSSASRHFSIHHGTVN